MFSSKYISSSPHLKRRVMSTGSDVGVYRMCVLSGSVCVSALWFW